MILVLIIVLASLAAASGAPEGAAGEPRDLSRLAWIEAIRPVTLRAGESTGVSVRVVVAEGFHVQANPAGNEFLVPLELVLDPVDGMWFGEPGYPAPEMYALRGADEDLLTYHGTVSVTLSVGASASAQAGERQVTGRLTYQACDSSRCYVPTSQPVIFSVVVAS